MLKLKTGFKVFHCAGYMALEEEVDKWLDEMNKKKGFDVSHTDQEIANVGGRPDIVLIVFYKIGV